MMFACLNVADMLKVLLLHPISDAGALLTTQALPVLVVISCSFSVPGAQTPCWFQALINQNVSWLLCILQLFHNKSIVSRLLVEQAAFRLFVHLFRSFNLTPAVLYLHLFGFLINICKCFRILLSQSRALNNICQKTVHVTSDPSSGELSCLEEVHISPVKPGEGLVSCGRCWSHQPSRTRTDAQ